MPTITRDGIASARIADSLREAILRGEIAPGERIRQEQVAADHDASRLPVREALRTLESEGLVTLVANTGAWVSHLSLSECDELYQIRERIEPLLLGYSIPNLDETTIARLDSLADEMQNAADVARFLHLDREFHLLSYSGASTLLLGDTVSRLWNLTQHYRRAYSMRLDRDGNRILHDEHHMLVRAIELRDADDAGRVLLGHIRRTRLELARHPDLFELR
ncbi:MULTISPECIES: GntR family transcriptional regulator [Subtercola]|uniref:GntR family transcriptional regulator n=1 Tax=Subtercola vilae TaxID=2056433 RepID=A0A4T2C2Q0_9MICO|nr:MULTISPECIES: GntR family transcriptional regulator [Subtercola]MEA9984152.1 GntR family transcriptional regulator [Subtercola sp. RTI3]TIH38633.1 GntR family transcriptional regulator [Subtercola vilae]